MTSQPIHVGVDATCWTNDRGFGRFTRELLTALAQRDSGFRYTLLFDRAPQDWEVPPGVSVATAEAAPDRRGRPRESSMRSADHLLRMGRLAGRGGYDLFFFPAVYSYYPVFSRTPCVVCYHDAIPERFPKLIFANAADQAMWSLKVALSKRQARRAMTVSEASARDIEAMLKIPRARIDVITEGPDAAFRMLGDDPAVGAIRERLGLPEGAPTLVYVGGFNRHKNVLGLLRAMPAVIDANPDVRLVIVGDTSGQGFWDNAPELKAAVAAHPALEAQVQFAGYLSDADLAALLNSAKALVFPSLMEGFGLPAIEAMACGAPVLASDRGSLPEVVGDAGLLFDPEDPLAIAASANSILSDTVLHEVLATRARERVKTFTWERAAELAEESFRKTLGR